MKFVYAVTVALMLCAGAIGQDFAPMKVGCSSEMGDARFKHSLHVQPSTDLQRALQYLPEWTVVHFDAGLYESPQPWVLRQNNVILEGTCNQAVLTNSIDIRGRDVSVMNFMFLGGTILTGNLSDWTETLNPCTQPRLAMIPTCDTPPADKTVCRENRGVRLLYVNGECDEPRRRRRT